MSSSSEQVVDVRQTPPPRRHPLIFGTFDTLQPGQAFILVNDHDPKPLYYQFRAEMDGQFSWDYLESGPQVWRVRIGKAGSRAARLSARPQQKRGTGPSARFRVLAEDKFRHALSSRIPFRITTSTDSS